MSARSTVSASASMLYATGFLILQKTWCGTKTLTAKYAAMDSRAELEDVPPHAVVNDDRWIGFAWTRVGTESVPTYGLEEVPPHAITDSYR